MVINPKIRKQEIAELVDAIEEAENITIILKNDTAPPVVIPSTDYTIEVLTASPTLYPTPYPTPMVTSAKSTTIEDEPAKGLIALWVILPVLAIALVVYFSYKRQRYGIVTERDQLLSPITDTGRIRSFEIGDRKSVV